MSTTVTHGAGAPDASATRPRYRNEIQGLRAVAALLVATFHIWLGRVSGGVDVFFVVSGFFITMTLFGHFDRFGAIRPLTYVARLLRRLLPGALLVLIVVFVGTLVLLPKGQWGNTFGEIVASALYFENWQLAFNSVDYLAAAQEHTAVQHFWAMSIQGQFYLVWLAIFLVIGALLKRRGLRAARTVALYAFGGVIVASFAYSVWFTAIDQPFAYFSTFTRAWEFGLGGVAAVLLPRIQIGPLVKAVMSWIGVIGVVSCGLVLQVSTVFPGYAALWPAVSALLILFGGGSGIRFSPDTVLGSRFFVWLGGLSYGIYLWHWPILVFARDVLHRRSDVGLKWGLLVLALAILAAWLTKVLVEKPIQSFEKRSPARGPRLSMAALATVVALVVVAGTVSIQMLKEQFDRDAVLVSQVEDDPEACFGARALDRSLSECDDREFADIVVPAISANLDLPDVYTDECRTQQEDDTVKECIRGVTGGATRVAVIGNSHSISWLPAIEDIAVQKDWEVHVFFRGACTFNAAYRADGNKEIAESCGRWNDKLEAFLAGQEPYDLVITSHKATGFWPDSHGKQDLDGAATGFRTAWQPLIDRGAHVLAIRDVPHSTPELITCVDDRGLAGTKDCTNPREDALPDADPIVQAATAYPGVSLIDMTDWFCGDDTCYTVIGHVKVYRDFHHFTASYSDTLAPYLYEAFQDSGTTLEAGPIRDDGPLYADGAPQRGVSGGGDSDDDSAKDSDDD